MENLKISISGIRGIVGETFTQAIITKLAAAFGQYSGCGQQVIVGRDTRQSGIEAEQAIVAGLVAVGCQPLLAGITPTPTIQLTVAETGACGGIMITASHNPEEWNGLKFISDKGFFLNSDELEQMLAIYQKINDNITLNKKKSEFNYLPNIFENHQCKIFNQINIAAIRKAKFSVAVDCGNGVGALFSPSFLEALGCRVFTVHDALDRGFERSPEPLPENLGKLTDTVKQHRCAVGFAQDPDGDRLTLVDGNGQALGEQNSLLLTLNHILAKRASAVVVNIQTTRAVEDIAGRYGCDVHYTRVGECNVVEKLLAVDGEIGGEGNCGGVIWSKVHPCRDSYVTMALMLEILAESGQSLAEMVALMPHYIIRSLKFPCNSEQAVNIVNYLSEKYSNETVCCLDGIRIDFEDYWVLVRESNTEPVLRLTIEALSVSLVEFAENEISTLIIGLINEYEK